MNTEILLLHGYSGSPADLSFLEKALSRRFPGVDVENMPLPGHGIPNHAPPFDEEAFFSALQSRHRSFSRERTKRIYIGHSTGGTILLAYLMDSGMTPDLLILIGVPVDVDISFFERWTRHMDGGKKIPFTATAKLVSFVNRRSRETFKKPFPVLIMHGDEDELVLSRHAFIWKERLVASGRVVIIPSGRHHITDPTALKFCADTVIRAVEDVISGNRAEDLKVANGIAGIEPELAGFIRVSPSSCRHIAASPGGKRAAGDEPDLSPVLSTEPVFANIEITTRCNLECTYCMRPKLLHAGEDMTQRTFARILDLLPHAYRITLVGLGEPLLHHNPAGLVAEAASKGRRVGIVTNGMCLDKKTGRALLDAGLHSIAFSLDAPDQESADIVRRGSDLERIIENIRFFAREAKENGTVATAVFSAVSVKTVSCLEELVNLVSDIGVHILMLTDLNFIHNAKDTLWKNINPETAAAVKKATLSAFSKKLPVLSVRALEEFGLWKRYDQFLLVPTHQLYMRSKTRSWCASPWQTIPVSVSGNISVCDCQPENIVGNILSKPFTEIWNSEIMVGMREQMLSAQPPPACRICPRF